MVANPIALSLARKLLGNLPRLVSRVAILCATLFFMGAVDPVYAQSSGGNPFPGHSQIPVPTTPKGGTSASGTIIRSGNNIVVIPKLAALVAYGLGTILTIIGLWKLRLWMMDNERNALNPALFRMIVGALLIALPHTIVVVNTTLFGSGGSSGTTNDQDIPVPKLFAYDRK